MNSETLKSWAFWLVLAFCVGFVVYWFPREQNKRLDAIKDELTLALDHRTEVTRTLQNITGDIDRLQHEIDIRTLERKKDDNTIHERVREVEKRVYAIEGKLNADEELEPEVIDEHYSPTVPHGIGPPHS